MKRISSTFVLLILMLSLPVVTPALAASLDIAALTATLTETATATVTPVEPFTCKIATITIVSGTETTVDVTCEGGSETWSLGLQAAQDLGLVSTDAVPLVDESKIGTDVTLDPADLITPTPTETPTATPAPHPVGSAIAEFFGLDAGLVESLHEDGAGFGVIAQACWMSYTLAGDASLCEQIVEAKQSRDFSSIILADGSTPANWGQFKKAASAGEKKQNLGLIMSGHAAPVLSETPEPSETITPSETPSPPASAGQGNENKPEKTQKPEKPARGNANANGNGNDNNNANSNDNNGGGNGNGKGKHD